MNPNDKTIEYLSKLKGMKLSESSRARMQADLLEYARFHSVKDGVRVGADSRSIGQVPQSTSLFNLFKQPKSMTAAIMVIVLLAGGGTSYAAEAAVPGDVLYPVKIEVNENIRSAFAISNEAEAKLQARLAEERLEEAEELSARGELTTEHAAYLGLRIKAHYDEAKELSAEAAADGNQEASTTVRSSLEGSLRAHANVLNDINLNVSGGNGVLDLNIGSDTDAEVRNETNTQSDTSTDDDNASSSIEVDTSVDGGLDTGVTDVDVETDAPIRSGISL
ncbi:hypothetical protein A2837_02485 [Candidatus Kaiserbacteria bacterium RIFCSPHIGHO2_01_FULL_46_22]|uniref:DUF5667 domain-containing protein n=1 Tax=Candidatus Kaiserbacteria bacterium RIFCSPHIGHO2_01_FULL_46_22 TaxID=1798475 RepID=A0A1F6BWQ5_9BACT|nr:MAG: hypothetical protein A2837_02485 [Candidatus Kaiserbacteria bacterium RIFCSPHIGHO2_01_FULL_46_22]